MKGNKLNDKLRLQHILQAIAYLDEWLMDKQYEDFENHSILLHAVCRQLEIIGEAANNLSVELQVQHDNVPWAKIVALRNLLIHEYFGVIPIILWQIIQTDLPPFKEQINSIFTNYD